MFRHGRSFCGAYYPKTLTKIYFAKKGGSEKCYAVKVHCITIAFSMKLRELSFFNHHFLHNGKSIAKILGGVVYDKRAVLSIIVMKHLARYDNFIVHNTDIRYLLSWPF